jgi:hypothetical protein
MLAVAHDYTRDALVAAAESRHGPDCLTHNYRIPTDGLCSCHVGKARFVLELAGMSAEDNLNLVKTEIKAIEISGPFADYEAAYRRALVKHARKKGIKLD